VTADSSEDGQVASGHRPPLQQRSGTADSSEDAQVASGHRPPLQQILLDCRCPSS